MYSHCFLSSQNEESEQETNPPNQSAQNKSTLKALKSYDATDSEIKVGMATCLTCKSVKC